VLPPLYQSDIKSLPLVARGKVRDIYAVGDDALLIVTTDRLSAFDVVMPDPIPLKGAVLNAMSLFWFDRLASIIPNHLTGVAPQSVVRPDEVEQVRGRAVVVKRLKPLPVEAVARGYLAGSGWKDYQRSGAICGNPLPRDLQQAAALPAPIFTPATKAEAGAHDENIDFAETVRLLGAERAAAVRDVTLRLYTEAARYARTHGIIIADTKFEFGIDARGGAGGPAGLLLIDEALTADSSRFWPADSYAVGTSPPSFDKQFVRDYLESIAWPKRPPAPALPAEIIRRTSEKYQEALYRLTGQKLN
jgi:phosphoribosylaminoimidazole-succinocarboxamide synthase